MKIAWMHSHFNYWMGGNKFILEVVKRLQKKTIVEIFIQNGKPEVISKFTEAGIRVRNLATSSTMNPLFWLGFPIFCLRDKRKLQAILDRESFDVVITSIFPMNYIANMIKVKRLYQYCYEPFAFFWDLHLRRNLPLRERIITGMLAFLYRRMDRRATRLARKIFTLSEVTRRQVQDVYGRDSIVTYEGVDTDFFKPTYNETLTKKYRKHFVILHTTDFTPIKRTDLAIKIFSGLRHRIPSAKLLITSTCENLAVQKRLMELGEKEGLRQSDIEFLGFVPHHLLPAYYSLANILLQSAINQPQTLPVKEALACCTPVARGVAEEVEFNEADGLGVIINPLEIEESVQKIMDFLKRGAFSGEHARTFVERKFCWDRISDIILENVKADS